MCSVIGCNRIPKEAVYYNIAIPNSSTHVNLCIFVYFSIRDKLLLCTKNEYDTATSYDSARTTYLKDIKIENVECIKMNPEILTKDDKKKMHEFHQKFYYISKVVS